MPRVGALYEKFRMAMHVQRENEVAATLVCFAVTILAASFILYIAIWQLEIAEAARQLYEATNIRVVQHDEAPSVLFPYAHANKVTTAYRASIALHPGLSVRPSYRISKSTGPFNLVDEIHSHELRAYGTAWSEALALLMAAFVLYATAAVSLIFWLRERLQGANYHRSKSNKIWSLVENLPAGVVLVQNERFYMNQIVESMTGYHSSEIPSLTTWFKLLYGDSASEIEEMYHKDKMAGFPGSSRVTIRAKNGRLKQIEFAACKNNGGEIWILRDVTEECAANEKFRVLFEHSSDAHLLFDETGLIDCNNAALRFIKVGDKAELLGKHPGTFSPPLQIDGTPSRVKAMEWDSLARETGHARFEWLRLASDGEVFPVEVSLTQVPLNGKMVLLDVWHDLREQKRAEAKLVRSEMAMQEAQALAHIGSIEYNLQSGETYWSAEALKLFATEVGCVPPSPDKLRYLMDPEATAQYLYTLKSVMHSGQDATVQVLVNGGAADTRYLNLLLRCEMGESSEPVRLIITAIDVTERHHYEESLKSALEATAAANAQLEAEILMVNNQSLELEYQKHELEAVNQRLHDLASRDGLTGLFNHRTFQERLRISLDTCASNGAPVALILLDVDFFKQYNDRYGHPAGDEVLRRVAGALLSLRRDHDIAARYGGEEFAIILPATAIGEALIIAEEVRLLVMRSNCKASGVTVSLGVTATYHDSSVAEQLIGEADSALYQSKHHGRNQSTCYDRSKGLSVDLPKAA